MAINFNQLIIVEKVIPITRIRIIRRRLYNPGSDRVQMDVIQLLFEKFFRVNILFPKTILPDFLFGSRCFRAGKFKRFDPLGYSFHLRLPGDAPEQDTGTQDMLWSAAPSFIADLQL